MDSRAVIAAFALLALFQIAAAAPKASQQQQQQQEAPEKRYSSTDDGPNWWFYPKCQKWEKDDPRKPLLAQLINTCVSRGGWNYGGNSSSDCSEWERQGWCNRQTARTGHGGHGWDYKWGLPNHIIYQNECGEGPEICEECGCTGSGTETWTIGDKDAKAAAPSS